MLRVQPSNDERAAETFKRNWNCSSVHTRTLKLNFLSPLQAQTWGEVQSSVDIYQRALLSLLPIFVLSPCVAVRASVHPGVCVDEKHVSENLEERFYTETFILCTSATFETSLVRHWWRTRNARKGFTLPDTIELRNGQDKAWNSPETSQNLRVFYI